MDNEIPQQQPLSKKERRFLRKQQRTQESEKAKKQKNMKKALRFSLWIIAMVVVIGFFVWKGSQSLPGNPMQDLGNEHIASVNTQHTPYNSVPPTSGPHLNHIAPWGISKEPIPNELQVHNLEDGGVMVQYWCGDGHDNAATSTAPLDYQKGCPELISQLEDIVKKYPERVLLAPYPNLPNKIALTAWTRIDLLDEFDAARIEKFIAALKGIDHHK